MKSEGAIRHKLKQVRFRYLKKRIEESLDKRPENCTNNGVLDMGMASPIRACFAQMDIPGRHGIVCDERFGGCARAEACNQFAGRHDKVEVKGAFYAELEGMSFPEIAYSYPDMAALLWVLADEGLDVPKPDPHEFDLSDVPVGSGIIAMGVSEHPVTASTDTGTTASTYNGEPHGTTDIGNILATAAASGAFGYREPEDPAKPPSWIDRILGRVSP